MPQSPGTRKKTDPVAEPSEGVGATRHQTGHRLRGHRIPVSELNGSQIEAEVWHVSAGRFEADVEDLSLHGARLKLKSDEQLEAIFPGDCLDRLLIKVNGSPLYSGSARIRRVTEEDQQRVFGVELEDEGADLNAVYRLDSLTTFSERFQSVASETPDVDTRFRVWVSEFEDYLDAIRALVDSEERQLAKLDRWSRESTINDYLEESRPTFVRRMLDAELELHELVNGFDENQHAVHRRYYHRLIYPYLRESAFLRRAMEKPMGYAGDYEMMNMLYRESPEGESLFACLMNAYGTNVRAAVAVRNRRDLLTKVINEAIEGNPGRRVRVASVGCGPAYEIQCLLERSPHAAKSIEVVLIDQEPQAIAFCQRSLGPLIARTGARVHVVRESIRKLIAHPSLEHALGKCDLIYSAGLFDYLDERPFIHLAGTLLSSLSPGGHLIIGNFAHGQPSRWFMEYCAEWFLIHRTPAQLLELGEAAGAPADTMSIMADPSGINLFLDVCR